MTEQDVIDTTQEYIPSNAAEIKGLKKMMTIIVQGMDELTTRVKELEKRNEE